MKKDVRCRLADLLRLSGIFTLQEAGICDDFIQGNCDVLVTDLDMDSLAAMELCIFLEEQMGLSLSPDQLMTRTSLEELVTEIASIGVTP